LDIKRRKWERYVVIRRERVVGIENKSKYGSQVKKTQLKNKKRRGEEIGQCEEEIRTDC